MFGSPRGTPMRTLDTCMEEHACVIRKDPSPGRASKEGRTSGADEEHGRGRKGGEDEGGKQRGKISMDRGMMEHPQPSPGPVQKS
ncbi:hypothetical protein NDU88_005499 [Pleurodeles waltl]|uniref:Uncharacterized protein n=1 Tax=Pleurodeles waltl TaxID=8319 RepID=A0AAV7LPP4_PLEWA|nr:hypothetical protein NDU88_005499 [Pleurodeles waltl]